MLPVLYNLSVLSTHSFLPRLYAAAPSATAKTTPMGISSGGIFLRVRRRWEIVCADSHVLVLLRGGSGSGVGGLVGGHTGVLFLLRDRQYAVNLWGEGYAYRHRHPHLRRSLHPESPYGLGSHGRSAQHVGRKESGGLHLGVVLSAGCRTGQGSMLSELCGRAWRARASFNGRTRNGCAGASRWESEFTSSTSSPDRIPRGAKQHLYYRTDTRANTANMSDDEERVTMPFKFVTGMSSRPLQHALYHTTCRAQQANTLTAGTSPSPSHAKPTD